MKAHVLQAALCVLGIASGQLLFKMSGQAMAQADNWLDLRAWSLLGSAMVLYALTSVGWVLVLRQAELGKIYPIMALAFLLVPLGSHWLFGEQFSTQYLLGAGFVLAGLMLIMTA